MLIPTLINCFCALDALDNEATRCDITYLTLNEHWLRGSTLDGDVKYKLTLLLIGTGHNNEWKRNDVQLHDAAVLILLLLLGEDKKEDMLLLLLLEDVTN
jgi:hypothetical protein